MKKYLIAATCLLLVSTPSIAKPVKGLKGNIWLLKSGDPLCIEAKKETSKEFFAAIFAAILPILVETGVKGIGNALATAAKPDEASVVSSTPGYFYDLTSPPQVDGVARPNEGLDAIQRCVVLVANHPQRAGASKMLVAPGTTTLTSQLASFIMTKGYGDSAEFAFVGSMRPARDGSAWELAPAIIWVGGALTEGGLRGDGRDLVLTFTVQGAASKDDENVLASRSVLIPRVNNGKWIYNWGPSETAPSISSADQTHNAKQFTIGWIPLPKAEGPLGEQFEEALQRRRDIVALSSIVNHTTAQKKQLTEMQAAINSEGTKFESVLPVTFKFELHETRDGNKFLQSVGEFLAANSGKIATPISDSLNPELRRTAATESLNSAQALRINAIEAVAEWQAVNDDPAAKPSDKEVKRIKARTACSILRLNKLDDPACWNLAGG